MRRPKVFIAKPVPGDVAAYLGEHVEIIRPQGGYPVSRETYFASLREAEGLLTTGSDPITDDLLEHAPLLKAISNISVGYNNFHLEAMKRRGIVGTNTPGVLDETVADLIFALMLAAARRVPELDRYVRAGCWQPGDGANLFGLDVHHRTLGIIGMGRIGQAVARRGKRGFGMNIAYCNRSRSPEAEAELGARYWAMDELLAESDFIVVMTPLTAETHRLIGREAFARMKRTAVFVNASRGQTVDEEALYDALKEGRIYAAGLDVFEREPIDPDHPLLALDNVVVLPHIGSATDATRKDMAMLAAENLVAALTGGQPKNVVNELRSV